MVSALAKQMRNHCIKGGKHTQYFSQCMCTMLFKGKVDFPRITFLSITKQDNSSVQCPFKLTVKGIKFIVSF